MYNRALFNQALRDAGVKTVATNRGTALANVRLNDPLPSRPPDSPDLADFVDARLEPTSTVEAIDRDQAWRLYCEWAGNIEERNEYARRRFFAAMRRGTKEVRRRDGWYYPGWRAKGGEGVAISPPTAHEPTLRGITVPIETGARPLTTSTMCWRDDHEVCAKTTAKCDCTCHGPAGKVVLPFPTDTTPATATETP
jgi:hypothetical protein